LPRLLGERESLWEEAANSNDEPKPLPRKVQSMGLDNVGEDLEDRIENIEYLLQLAHN
jgi:hypothetical protein